MRLHFYQTARHKERVIFIVSAFNADFTRLQPGYHGSMTRRNAHFAKFSRSKHHFRQSGIDFLFCTYYIYMYGHGHFDHLKLAFQSFCFFKHFIDGSHHVKSLFRDCVVFTFNNSFKTGDSIFQ